MFTDALISLIRAKNSRCIVGLDPNIDLIPEPFKAGFPIKMDTWQADVSHLYFEYNKLVIDNVHEFVPAVKPQVAYYEPMGAAGIACLTDTVNYARSKGLLVIVDAKRNDIGSTSAAYASAYLDGGVIPGAPPAINGDALTVSPFMGMDSMEPFIKAVKKTGKGLFVLVRTSNPGSPEIQSVPTPDGDTVAEALARRLHAAGQALLGAEGYSSIGAVVGATYPEEAQRLRARMPQSFFLVPGYGTQGGSAAGLRDFFNADGLGAIVNASRSVCFPSDKQFRTEDLPAFFRARTEEMVRDVNQALE